MDRERFLVHYTAWRCENRLPSEPKIPFLCGMNLNIADVWTAVQEQGGSRQVSERRLWASIGRRLNPPQNLTNFSYHLKNIFVEHLLEYERYISPGRAIPKLPEVANNQSSKTNSISPTLFEDAYPSQTSSGPTKRPRSPSMSFDLPFSTLAFTAFGRQQPIDLSENPVAVLALAYAHCDGLLKFLHDALENAKINERKSRRMDKPVSGENNNAADGGGDRP